MFDHFLSNSNAYVKESRLVILKIIDMIFSKHLFLIYNCQKNVLHFLNVSFIKCKWAFVIFMRPSVTCENI